MQYNQDEKDFLDGLEIETHDISEEEIDRICRSMGLELPVPDDETVTKPKKIINRLQYIRAYIRGRKNRKGGATT